MRRDRVSRTAVKIAKGLVYLDADPVEGAVLPPRAAASSASLLTASGLMAPWERKLVHHRWFRRFAAWTERKTMPGISLHLGVRKRFIEDEVRRSIAAGARELLVIGAGFDTLASRLALEHPAVGCIELDHPATQSVKRKGLERLGQLPPNLELVAVDLAETSLDEALARTSWDAGAPGVGVCEGVLMYLDRTDVNGFFAAVARSMSAASRLIFTCLRTDEAGRPFVGRAPFLMNLSLRLIGEPFRWAIARAELGRFLEERSFRLEKNPSPAELRRDYLEPVGLGEADLGDAELLVVARPTGA